MESNPLYKDNAGYTSSTDFYPVPSIAEGSDLDLKIRAVEAAVRLYADKTATNLADYNLKFEELTTKIYNFYGSNKELH